ncbi:YlxR family protein [Fimbriimonas ginsengisoli]|uniref:YlxR family protein n=1 Tax=Fimbriimonas ginsengisoli TaxID=1005039 RepID=UPI0009FEBC02
MKEKTLKPDSPQATSHRPHRTCIACRRKGEQGSFFRVSRSVGGCVTLWQGNGRSAYMCRTAACVEAALSKGRLDRAIRGRVDQAERIALREILLCKLR